jgi:DNA-binding MarR family transcriptional regulator
MPALRHKANEDDRLQPISIECLGLKVLNLRPLWMTTTMQNGDLPDHVLVALRRIIRATDLHSRKLGKKTGLTTPQLVIIQAVGDLKDPTVSDIAKAVSLSLATVTTILNRLERNGIVNRARSSVDRRRVIVTLTEEGRDLKSSAPKPLQDSFVDRFTRLESWEQHLIVASLERVAAMMDADDLDAAPLLASGDSVI